MNKTSIEWTDYTWNPVTGCDKISAGCRSCYAETLANRFWGDRKFTDVQIHHERLMEPVNSLKKLKGKKVFVCDVSDLFHDDVPFEFIGAVLAIMLMMPETIFQVLTKRPKRAVEFFNWLKLVTHPITGEQLDMRVVKEVKNIWIGVSCENQEQADKRIPLLLQIPAAVRFLSCEPLIGPIDLTVIAPESKGGIIGSTNCLTGEENAFTHAIDIHSKVDWVICGGESGHQARPMHPEWVRSLRDQCAAANVPFFFKQWGEYAPLRECSMHDVRKLKRAIVSDPYEHMVFRIGKSKSGNLLDSKQHLNFPAIKSNV